MPLLGRASADAEPQIAVTPGSSRLEPYGPDAEGEPTLRRDKGPGDTFDRPSPLALADGNRFLRGTLTHALLEHLPSLPQETRARTGS